MEREALYEALNEERVNLQKKIETLQQQKTKLSGSKKKRERSKVNKQVTQAQRRLEVLQKEEERLDAEEVNKKATDEKNLEDKKTQEKQRKDDKNYILECEEKHQLKDATIEEIKERIAGRESHFKEFHHAEYWIMLVDEQEQSMKKEEAKQTKFLRAHGLTPKDQEAVLEKVKARRAKEEEEKKAKQNQETEPEAKTETEEDTTAAENEESAPKDQVEQTEEIVFLNENSDNIDDIPKPFPGYKQNDHSGPEEAGPSEGPEETGSEKPLEPEQKNSAEVTAEEVAEAKSETPVVAKSEEPQQQQAVDSDRKNYGSSQYWDDRYEKFADKTEEWYEGWKSLKEIIAPFISKDMMLLDLGCGDSFMQDELDKEGFNCFGTDISNVVLQRLSENPNREMFSADGFAMPLRTNSWDAIIDKGTLDAIACDEHRDLTPLFEEIYRVLSPGGRYLCITPWHAEKRMPQLSAVPWNISHEVMPMSPATLAKQRFNQLKNNPKLGRDRKLLMKMSTRQAQTELAALNIEEAKNLPPERSCVIHCYVCQKTSS